MKHLLVVCFFVCPLLFFTDLTRNPYYTQIALLNVCLLVMLGLHSWRCGWGGEWRIPKTPLDLPWVATLAVCAGSWFYSYWVHGSFFGPAMVSEARRIFLFTLTNTFLVFYLTVILTADSEPRLWRFNRPAARTQGEPRQGEDMRGGPIRLAPWVVFVAVWSAGWALYPFLRAQGRPAGVDILPHLWDPYGAFLWAGGLAAALWLCRRGDLSRIHFLAVVAGFLAAGYGILQYFNTEWIWPKVLNPYGGRAVSTFGNPNFLSSYLVVLAPSVALLYLREERLGRRIFMGVVFLVMGASVLASLTRSSWIGFMVGIAATLFSPEVRRMILARKKALIWLLAPALLIVCFWPRSMVGGYQPTVIKRLLEIKRIFVPEEVRPDPLTSHEKESSLTKRAERAKRAKHVPYKPWDQRRLIWGCAWQMGLENPVSGKGWGMMELFYPFYQGPFILSQGFFRTLRTHANNAHNEILEVFSQTGLLGLGIFLWFWVVFFKMAVSRIRHKGGTGEDWFWVTGLSAGMLGMLFDNLFNVSLHFAVPGFVFWWAGGAACSRASRPAKWRVWRSGRALGMGIAAVVIVGVTAGCWFWFGQWRREVHYFTGFKLMRQGKVPAAVRQLEAAYSWNSREVNNNYEMGNGYARNKNHEKAVWAYGEALRANCGYDEIYFNRATVLGTKLNRWGEAERDYMVSLFVNPLNKNTYVNLGAYYLRFPVRFADKLVSLLDQAVSVFPDDASFYNNLGYVHTRRGKTALAAGAYIRALEIDPDFAVAEKNLVKALGKEKAKDVPVLRSLALLRDLGGRVERREFSRETLAIAERLAKVFPGHLKTKFYLGALQLVHGRLSEARGNLEWVLSRNPRYVSARLNLGVVLEKQGHLESAMEEFKKVLKEEPGNSTARERIKVLKNILRTRA